NVSVAGYLVSTAAGYSRIPAGATSLTVGDLQPSSLAGFGVAAFDADGNLSPFAQTNDIHGSTVFTATTASSGTSSPPQPARRRQPVSSQRRSLPFRARLQLQHTGSRPEPAGLRSHALGHLDGRRLWHRLHGCGAGRVLPGRRSLGLLDLVRPQLRVQHRVFE